MKINGRQYVVVFNITGDLLDITSLRMVVITYRKQSMDQPRMVANPARGQLIGEKIFFPFPVRA